MKTKKPEDKDVKGFIALLRATVSGTASIVAAAADAPESSGKLPSVDVVVYGGGKINVGYWGKVVVDLAGMKVSDKTPILFGHNTFDIDAILGQTDKVVADNTLHATGHIMGTSDVVTKALALAKNGYVFQSSMGATPIKIRQVAEGEQAEANGQTHDGPFTLVVESQLNEISLLPLGADGSTSAAIAASHSNEETENMKKKPDGSEMTAEEVRAEAVVEEQRILAVRKIASEYPEIAAKAVADGWDSAKTEIAVQSAVIEDQKKQLAAKKVQDERPGGFTVMVSGAAKPVTARAVEAAVAIRAGLRSPEKVYDEQTLDIAAGAKIHSITDMFRACLRAEGKPSDVTRHDTESMLRAGFSTVSLANVLGAVVNKFVLQGYGTVEQTWRLIANVRSVVDFKAHTGVRLVMANLLQNLAPNGEIKHGTLSDETRSIQADTKALMLAITRKDIINDDLGVLQEVPTRLGYAAARTLNADFWAQFQLASALASRFTTSGAIINRQTGGALSIANLKTARALFRKMKDSDGNPLGVEPSILLVSPNNEAAADEIYVSTNLVGGTTKDTSTNIFKGRFKPAVSTYLDDAPWYLVADPMAMPAMEVAFLNGVQVPTIESANADFNTLGIQMRAFWDYGTAFAERRGIVRSDS